MRTHRITEVPDARSFALSVSDTITGRQAMVALKRWNGDVVSVTEGSIRDAVRKFAQAGLLVEPATSERWKRGQTRGGATGELRRDGRDG